MSLQAGYSKLLPGVNFAIKRRSGSLLVSQIAILTATPTNFREKARSAANDEPCEPASGASANTGEQYSPRPPFGITNKSGKVVHRTASHLVL